MLLFIFFLEKLQVIEDGFNTAFATNLLYKHTR